MPNINYSQYQFSISNPYRAGHVLTELEANVLNYHRADLIRKTVVRWVAGIEATEREPVLRIETLDMLENEVALLDASYKFAKRQSPGMPAFTNALYTVAVNAVTREEDYAPQHLIEDFDGKVAAAMRDPANRQRAREQLITSLESVYGGNDD